MSQLTKEKSDWLYPKKSNRLYVLNHSLNESKTLGRGLESIKLIADEIIVGIDDRTTDNTKEIAESYGAKTFDFKWMHSFSDAKNGVVSWAIRNAGLKFGDWIVWLGGHFEYQPHVLPEIREFISDDLNFFGSFWIPEYNPIFGEATVSRRRKILYRHHSDFYWEKLVNEEVVYSAYRKTGRGIPFGGVKWKEFPVLGGANGILHYGYHECGGDDGLEFEKKRQYYFCLVQIDKAMRIYNLNLLDALRYMANNPNITDSDKTITTWTEALRNGEIVYALSPYAADSQIDLLHGHL